MSYLILKENIKIATPNYRGTHRDWIGFQDKYPENHEVNQAFFRFLSEIDELRVLADFDVAREIVDTFQQYVPSEPYEVVAISTESSSTCQGEFLGYDVSSKLYLSYLSNGLKICQNGADNAVGPLLCLMESYFVPRLNENDLFNEYEDGIFLLSCIASMDKLQPAMWDNPSTYSTVGLWKVYP